MYIIINRCYGGFQLSDEFCEKYNRSHYLNLDERTNIEIIKEICEFGFDNASGGFSKIRVAKISDDVTDYDISDYDGVESVISVVDGKISYEFKIIENEQDVII